MDGNINLKIDLTLSYRYCCFAWETYRTAAHACIENTKCNITECAEFVLKLLILSIRSKTKTKWKPPHKNWTKKCSNLLLKWS